MAPRNQQVSTAEATDLVSQVFRAARARQFFGVSWHSLTDDQKVDYVKQFLGREVWFHQKKPLLTLTDPVNKSITYNASRQTGKCCEATSYITLSNGSVSQIKDLPLNTPVQIASVAGNQVKAAWGIVTYSGIKPVAEHTYFASESITTTLEHRLLRRRTKRKWKDAPVTYEGYDWVEAGKQLPRDHIATVASLELLTSTKDYDKITDNEIKFLAYHLADGFSSKNKRSQGFTTASIGIEAELDSIAHSFGTAMCRQKQRSKAYDFNYTKLCRENENGLVTRLASWGLAGKNCYEKFIPSFVFNFSKRQLSLFINRFFACDGYAAVCGGSTEIGCTLANRLMVSQLANVLKMLGFSVRVKSSARPCIYPDGSRKYFKHWSVCISKSMEQFLKFEREVNIYGKEERVAACVAEVRKRKGSYRHLHSFDGGLRYAFFQKSVAQGSAETYDIQVVVPPEGAGSDYEPNFIANGFVVHNSESMTWAEIICATHNTHPALDGTTKVVGLANKFSQTQIVGNRLRALLNENYEKTRFFWDREGSTKSHVVFKHEGGVNSKETGTIDYVTANPKAFSEGFTASIAFVDEANRLDKKVLSEVILPYLSSTNGTIVLTGVSRGKGAFYDACNSKDYIHLHYPWDAVETYRRAAPVDILLDNGTVKEVGLYPLDVMPISLKRLLFPTNPMLHILPTVSQKERWVRLWDLSDGRMAEEDFRSQYQLEWLAAVLALLQLEDQRLLFESGTFEPLTSGAEGEYYFGLDCGGSRNAYAQVLTNKDRAALSIFRRVGHIKQKVFCDERDDVLPEELVTWLREWCHPQTGRFKCRYGTVDVTGSVGAFASQHLKDCGIPIIPIFYGKTEEITKKNFKNAMFDYFKLENAAGRVQYPSTSYTDDLNEITLQPKYPTFYEHRNQWEIIERRLTTSVNSVITAPSGEHDDGPNSDVLCVYGMDHPEFFQDTLNIKKRTRHAIITQGTMHRGGASWARGS